MRDQSLRTHLIIRKRIWTIAIVIIINHMMMKKMREHWDMTGITIVVIMINHAPATRMNFFF